ncbi:MAG TPA: hypothetical protein DGG94_16360 [Micromonosporaceae bacterium]|nr:hypothetical protein [Micromonosporaceae bacterium]HCU51344.1 hypothetical protein [Micromonosporaceae bacterium]
MTSAAKDRVPADDGRAAWLAVFDIGVSAQLVLLRRKARRQLAELSATIAQLEELQEAVRVHRQRLAQPSTRA